MTKPVLRGLLRQGDIANIKDMQEAMGIIYPLIFSYKLTYKNVFINDRTKTFHRKNPYFNILHLISIIMGGSLPKFQDT